ncbi:MAG: PilZ domain-containing protein [Acidobacteriota bacterium]|nr:PilZ domain-containing protein [Acidobacteriota bacterium]
MRREERRRYQRVALPTPLRGSVDSTRIYVIDISVLGVRVAHQDPLPAAGSNCMLRFESNVGAITLDCRVVRTTLHKPASPTQRAVYHSGLAILQARAGSDRAVKELIAYYVERALDEQKANARGIPATAALSFQTGKGTDFLKLEFSGTKWRRVATKDPAQPFNGFTVSASETEDNIAMLCSAYEEADTEGRRLLKIMAELSVSNAEGIPTRRYSA